MSLSNNFITRTAGAAWSGVNYVADTTWSTAERIAKDPGAVRTACRAVTNTIKLLEFRTEFKILPELVTVLNGTKDLVTGHKAFGHVIGFFKSSPAKMTPKWNDTSNFISQNCLRFASISSGLLAFERLKMVDLADLSATIGKHAKTFSELEITQKAVSNFVHLVKKIPYAESSGVTTRVYDAGLKAFGLIGTKAITLSLVVGCSVSVAQGVKMLKIAQVLWHTNDFSVLEGKAEIEDRKNGRKQLIWDFAEATIELASTALPLAGFVVNPPSVVGLSLLSNVFGLMMFLRKPEPKLVAA